MIADRWGVTPAEVERAYPCDEFVPTPALQVWRAVTVDAAAERIWPWIGQLRLAPYSYDWIDNLGRRSPQTLQGLVEPGVGEHFITAAALPIGRILSVTTSEQLTARIGGAVMSYLLVPRDASTRLLLKIVLARGRYFAPALSVGDLIMARRQLLNLKRLAESSESGAAS